MQGPFFLLVVFISIIGFFIFMYFVPVGLWITAVFAGVKVILFFSFLCSVFYFSFK
jgi:uncharacterized protein YqfA (UPF0365 family)